MKATLLMSLRKQVDGLVNVYCPPNQLPSTLQNLVRFPSRIENETSAFRWLLQHGAKITDDMTSGDDLVSGDYEVMFEVDTNPDSE